MQKFRAAVLSDGSLRPSRGNACFHIGLSDNRKDLTQREQIPVEELLKFLQRFVTDVLRPLGVEPCSGHPKIEHRLIKSKDGKWLPGVTLWTRVSDLSTELYHKYYPDGERIIPEDFALTDVFLAWFFMFDGTAEWNSSGGPGVSIYLGTEGFDLRSIELFEEQLHKLGVDTGRRYYKGIEKGAGIGIRILADSTNHFMQMIDPHVIQPYRFKIKYRGGCPPELAERNREHYNRWFRDWRSKNKERYNEYQRKRRKEKKMEEQTVLEEEFGVLRQRIRQ